jgi:hypothetical protein
MQSIENPPGWAFSWCWYFFIISLANGLGALSIIVLLVTSFKDLMKMKALLPLFIYLLVFVIQTTTALVTFWMCRSSLKPKKENFTESSLVNIKNPQVLL